MTWTLDDPGLPPVPPGFLSAPWPPPEYAGLTKREQMIATRASLLEMEADDERARRLILEIEELVDDERAVERLCR